MIDSYLKKSYLKQVTMIDSYLKNMDVSVVTTSERISDLKVIKHDYSAYYYGEMGCGLDKRLRSKRTCNALAVHKDQCLRRLEGVRVIENCVDKTR